jgi:Amiloride-sensitive sodium channel.
MPPKKMVVHGPDDFPEDTAIVKFLPVGQEILRTAIPTSGYCTEETRILSPLQRECVFEYEKKLTYFPVYSENNCNAECHMEHTFNYCNCSHFYYHDTGKQPAALYYLLHLVHPHLAYVWFNRPNFEACLFHKYQNWY